MGQPKRTYANIEHVKLRLPFGRQKKRTNFVRCSSARPRFVRFVRGRSGQLLSCKINKETIDEKVTGSSRGASDSKFKILYAVLGVLAIGILLIFHSWFSKSKNERSMDLNTVNTIEEKTAALARLMNAISLQNEFNDGSVTMKEVMAKALDVRNLTLLDSIDEKASRVAVKAVKTFDLITARPAQTINETTEKLSKVLLLGNSTSHSSSISQMFSSLNNNDFNIDLDTISSSVDRSIKSLNNLSHEISSSNPKFDMAVEHFTFFHSPMLSAHSEHLTTLKKKNISIQKFENSLKDLRSFVVDIEQYQFLTNETFLNNLKTSLNSLLLSVSTIMLDAKNKHHAIKMLDDINTILAASVFGYDQKLLVGFPKGSKDFTTLFENLEEDWIKGILNGGKTVSKLIRVLEPMTKFQSQLSSLEQTWIKSHRETYANTTRKSLISLRIINKANLVDVSDSLSMVNTTFVILGSTADVNSTVLDEFKQLLSSSDPFTSFKTQLAGFLDAPEIAQFSVDELYGIVAAVAKQKKDEEKFGTLKEKLNIPKYLQNLEFFQNQLNLLVSAKNATTGYFKTIVEFNRTITDTIITSIRNLIKIPQNVKSEITVVENLVELLNSLPSLSEKERKVIYGISDFLVSVKSKMNDSKLLEESLQLEMKETGFLHRLSGFSSARNLTSQLAYTERTLHLFQREDLNQDIQNLATNGEKLVEFIESLPANEKQQVGSGWSNISSLNKSLSSLLPVIKSLPSNSTLPESNLTSFGKSLFFLDANKIPEFNFSSMVSAINYLKSSRVGQSEKVLNAEQSLIKLEGLQYASMRQNGTLGTLLGQADNFFTTFFSKTPDEKSLWPIVLAVLGVLAVMCVLCLCLGFCKKWSQSHYDKRRKSPTKRTISKGPVVQKAIDNKAAGQTENSVDPIPKGNEDKRKTKNPEASGGAKKVVNEINDETETVKSTQKRIIRNDGLSLNRMASQLGIARSTVQSIVKNDLKLKSYKLRRGQYLSDKSKAMRLEKCRKLLQHFQVRRVSDVIWTDEKIFTIEPLPNRQNQRQLLSKDDSMSPKRRLAHNRLFPKSVMVWAGITATGKTPLVFIERNVKINSEVYQKIVLMDNLLPWVTQHFAGGPYILQQDWAPSHGSRSTLAVLEAHFPGFLDKNLWPASSPDLNPMDFSVWGMLEGKIAGKVFATVDDLKAALEVAWASIDDGYLRRTVNSVKKRLRACVKARGSNFEILL
uniref:HTH luxR-type domain-containing protein n=1 Tax=Caenorhabditis japonica TaxID=281687 RepID=A0A8R1IQT9_CAEJA